MTIVQTLIGIFFLLVGVPKLFRLGVHRKLFEKYGYPLWLLTLVGLVETTGGAFLLLGNYWINLQALSIIGVTLITADMIGVAITHFRAREWSMLSLPLILSAIAIFIGINRY